MAPVDRASIRKIRRRLAAAGVNQDNRPGLGELKLQLGYAVDRKR